jgi:drug/metabolite transporter (DMT)-like permease
VTLAQLVMTQAYRLMPVSLGSSMQMTLPVITAIGGFFCFGESFHALEIGGAALTLFATWRVVAAH